MLASHPAETAGMVAMKAVEFGAAALGVLASVARMPEIRLRR